LFYVFATAAAGKRSGLSICSRSQKQIVANSDSSAIALKAIDNTNQLARLSLREILCYRTLVEKGGSHVSAQSLVVGVLAIVLLASGASAQEIYRWRDAQGTVHFADKPPPYPADVTLLDGHVDQPSVSTPAAQSKPVRTPAKSYFTSGGRPTASRSILNRSISSQIAGSRRQKPQSATSDAASGESSAANSGTGLSDLAPQESVVRRYSKAAAARRAAPADDLAVPSLDSALSQTLSAEGGSQTTASRSARKTTQSSLSQLLTADP
jgi:hypothetical protein